MKCKEKEFKKRREKMKKSGLWSENHVTSEKKKKLKNKMATACYIKM